MRLGDYIIAANVIVASFLPAAISAQEYSARNQRSTSTILRPAQTVAWRNYVTVPDGPCGCPMSVEADCYNPCPHPVFSKRLIRMFDCLLPCNLCCGTGGCGLLHGCKPGKCSICCGVACSGDGGCGSCSHSNCCPNPCGSAFAPVAPSCGCGHHCTSSCCTPSCSSALPALSDPFTDDPPLPRPTSEPATEVRRAPAPRSQPVTRRAAPAPPPAPAPRPSPYKIAKAPGNVSPMAKPAGQASAPPAPAASPKRSPPDQSVLRRASAEEESVEPAPLFIDHSTATPINRSSAQRHSAAPSNPLR